jgi:deoxycytidylate deaminase
MNENQFEIDDRRDKYDERTKFGQTVDFCVDDADVLIDNDRAHPTPEVAIGKLKDKILPYVNLMKGDLSRTPSPLELYMGLAYTASLQSKCVKRRVGAVIVDEKYNAILSVGYNENPHPMESCVTKYHQCYRDIFKAKYFKHLENLGQKCPKCDMQLKDLKPPFLCKCGFDLDKNLVGDKAMNRCTALHAEEKAILNIGSRNVEGYTIYTTTFPCFTCAQKIAYSRLASVVYVEPYPDQDALDLLEEAEISVRKFEGVKAKAYFRLFGSWQREMEASLSES